MNHARSREGRKRLLEGLFVLNELRLSNGNYLASRSGQVNMDIRDYASPFALRCRSSRLNHPRLEAGGFRVSIGNRLSSATGSPSCSSMYSRVLSSVMVPGLTAKYPRAQKCLPQNFFPNEGKSCRSTGN